MLGWINNMWFIFKEYPIRTSISTEAVHRHCSVILLYMLMKYIQTLHHLLKLHKYLQQQGIRENPWLSVSLY